MTSKTISVKSKEKNGAALSSVIAAIGLTTFKIVIGVLTGSLGILAEAAHSALDLVAALMTLFAVKIADKPADYEHPYGHGKVENLSALFETLLLLITCAWIIYEAVKRLMNPSAVVVEVTYWSFIVMTVSIIIDISRSRVLMKTAKKYNSQALEADALHFSTDVWSSSVVILGLIALLVSRLVSKLQFLEHADAIAALVVAAIVIYVSIRLGFSTIKALIDSAPKGSRDKIVRITEAVPGVKNVHNIRIRTSGAHLFIDIHIMVDGEKSLKDVHCITDKIEQDLKMELPEADITVHPEPNE
jgi:cation diffusion facilitator family transporter